MRRLALLALLIAAPAAAQGPADPDPAAPDPPVEGADPPAPAGTDRGGMAGGRTLVDDLDEDQPLEVGAQLRIFRQARRRKAEIERMEGLLERRARRLTDIQTEIASRYKTLRLLQEEVAASEASGGVVTADELAAREAQAVQAREDEVRRLSKVVDKMKAAEAATMLAVMHEPLVVEVMLRLKPKQAGRILGGMEPEQAARIGEQMARVRRQRQRGN